ncbi:MAG: hypothetical protein JZD41_07610 [Thermoproteus sp.]|nr:hypothetical protein [Thermoproteus sp.]
MSLAGIRYEYIQAERGTEVDIHNIKIKLIPDIGKVVRKDNSTEVPFELHLNSKTMKINIRGTVVVQGNVDLKELSRFISKQAADLILYEALFIARELAMVPRWVSFYDNAARSH